MELGHAQPQEHQAGGSGQEGTHLALGGTSWTKSPPGLQEAEGGLGKE